MKTSNKIITGFFLVVLMITISTMAFVRNGTYEKELIKSIGEKTNKKINFKYLRALDISVGKITLIQQEGPSHIEIKCAENIRQYLVQEVEDNEFFLGVDEGENVDLDLDVIVYVQNIESIIISGRAALKGNGTFKTDSLRIKTYGTASLQMDIAADFLKLIAANASKLNLNGTANFLRMEAHHGGRIEAENLVAKEVDAYAGNAGHINIHASEKLSVNINNAGRINYLGYPQLIKNSINSAGTLNSINPSK